MKVYDINLLKNRRVRSLADGWAEKGLITQSTHKAINDEYSILPYQPHWFLWIGLFVFTLICISSGGIIFLPFIDVPGSEKFFPPLFGLILIFLLDYFIRNRKLHFSGIDNALLYSILICFVIPITQIGTEFDLSPWQFSLLFLPLFLVLTYRYGEPLIALGCLLNGLFVLATLAMEYSLGKLLLPFIVMIYAGISAYLIHGFLQRDGSFYWSVCLHWLRIGALILLYMGGNYAIVREGNASLNSIVGLSPEIAFSAFFWLLTFLIPVVYIYLAFRIKALIFLSLGSITFIASLITWHHYYGFLPNEWALTLLGVAGIGVAIFLMRYLSIERGGFVYVQEENSESGLVAGNIIAMQISGNTTSQPQGTPLGGGDFGGGGSGETY